MATMNRCLSSTLNRFCSAFPIRVTVADVERFVERLRAQASADE
jgi:hypothetical protein